MFAKILLPALALSFGAQAANIYRLKTDKPSACDDFLSVNRTATRFTVTPASLLRDADGVERFITADVLYGNGTTDVSVEQADWISLPVSNSPATFPASRAGTQRSVGTGSSRGFTSVSAYYRSEGTGYCLEGASYQSLTIREYRWTFSTDLRRLSIRTAGFSYNLEANTASDLARFCPYQDGALSADRVPADPQAVLDAALNTDCEYEKI